MGFIYVLGWKWYYVPQAPAVPMTASVNTMPMSAANVTNTVIFVNDNPPTIHVGQDYWLVFELYPANVDASTVGGVTFELVGTSNVPPGFTGDHLTLGNVGFQGNMAHVPVMFNVSGTFIVAGFLNDEPLMRSEMTIQAQPHPGAGVLTDITVAVEGDPNVFYTGEVYTFIITHYPAGVDVVDLGLRLYWELRDGYGVQFHGGERDGNVLRQRISFRRAGTWNLGTWFSHNRETTLHEMEITVRQGTGNITPPIYTPANVASVRSGGGSPSPAPGSPQANFSTGMSFANRTAINVRNTATNATTGESILQSIQAGLPSGVTAEWSQHSPFVIVPATNDTPGSITGTVIITSNNWYRSAIRFNFELPALTAGDTE